MARTINKSTFTVFLGAALLTLVACSKSGSNDSGKSEHTQVSGTYQFEENGCATGSHEYTSLEQYCVQLLDESLNKGCAQRPRFDEFKLRCAEHSSPSPAPVPPPVVRPTPTPVPGPTPDHRPTAPKDCFDTSSFPKAQDEISIQNLIDGKDGYYRLVTVDTMNRIQDGDRQGSVRAMASVDTENDITRPTTKSVVTCKQFVNARAGELEGSVNAPISIRRESGVLKNSLDVSYKVYNPNLSMSDRVESDSSRNSNIPSIQALLALSSQMDSEMHIYRVSPTSIQIVIQAKKTDDKKVLLTATSLGYVFQPVSVDPNPSRPTPPPSAGGPGPNPSEQPSLPSGSIAKLCMSHSYVDDRVSCMKEFANKSVQENIVPICSAYSYLDDKVDCLKSLANKTFNDDVVKICSGYSYTSDKVDCLKEFANKTFSSDVIKVCSGYSYISDKVDCIKGFAK